MSHRQLTVINEVLVNVTFLVCASGDGNHEWGIPPNSDK